MEEELAAETAAEWEAEREAEREAKSETRTEKQPPTKQIGEKLPTNSIWNVAEKFSTTAETRRIAF
jgi:hypothetical protein